jgi:hypothetical protein
MSAQGRSSIDPSQDLHDLVRPLPCPRDNDVERADDRVSAVARRLDYLLEAQAQLLEPFLVVLRLDASELRLRQGKQYLTVGGESPAQLSNLVPQLDEPLQL